MWKWQLYIPGISVLPREVDDAVAWIRRRPVAVGHGGDAFSLDDDGDAGPGWMLPVEEVRLFEHDAFHRSPLF